jgi:hypothetical protein
VVVQSAPLFVTLTCWYCPSTPTPLPPLLLPCSDLSGFKLKGSIPSEGSIWSSLPGLTTLSFAGSGVSGPVPATLSGAPQLSSM